MSEITCEIGLENLMEPDACEGSASGVKRILMALKRDVLTWPALATTRETPESFVETTGNFAMATSKYFIEIQGDSDLTEFKIEGQGANNQVTGFRMSLDFNRSGLDSKALGTFSAIKRSQVVFLVLDNNGKWFIMGDKDRGAMMSTVTGTTGKAFTDQNGFNPVFTYDSTQPLVYTGDNIDELLAPAVAS